MRIKFDTYANNQEKEVDAYISHIKLNQTILLFRHWVKNKNRLINKPCDEKSSVYSIAKLVDSDNPLPLMMPEVFFRDDYSSTAYESWEDLYLKDDLFISLENLHNNNHQAFSLETVFLANKYNGFLRTNLRFDDRKLTVMSNLDQQRFLTQLKKRYPSYYEEYLDAQPSKEQSSPTEIDKDKLNLILNTVEIMLVLSCHKGGLRSTTLPNSITDFLSAYGYSLLTQVLSENLSKTEMEGLKHLWAKNIRNPSEKTVEDLIDSALGGACTTTLGLYWLGLIKEFRENFSFTLNQDFLDAIYENFVTNNPNESAKISKTFFMKCIKENMQYIATEMLNPVQEHRMVNTHMI
ncbi:hypothetical protein [Legionella maioricensis]|uniref:Uncharacterized protein n=1 Tax=Legionella maioricensis TaxID=2896528 RepID=A0A9X2CXK3_9GAMM|nr:hypothetical protein [Legionella maioricensis]MCL9682648.1 hypothetical protein [Legionella maioricensis]MCL9687305.1 hypothetical protein [Legionella maioricensis]